MKPLSYISALLAAAISTLAAPPRPGPSVSSNPSGTSGDSSALDCSQFNPVESGNFIVNPDQWGQVSSSTCVQIHSSSQNSLSWSWPNGGNTVKSYPNVELNNWECKPLNSYNDSIQTSWSWNYTPGPISADVSYDAFISTGSCGASHKAEIMIWLAAYDLIPITKTRATPYKTDALPGYYLFVGTNTQTNVPAYSFVTQKSPMKTYSGNLMPFFTYLKSAKLIDGTEYLQEMHAGTEPASGTNVKFTTSAFTLTSG